MSDVLHFTQADMEPGDSFQPVTNHGVGDYKITLTPVEGELFSVEFRDEDNVLLQSHPRVNGSTVFMLNSISDLKVILNHVNTAMYGNRELINIKIIPSAPFNLNGACLSPDYNYLYLRDHNNSQIKRYDVSTTEPILVDSAALGGDIVAMTFNPIDPDHMYVSDSANYKISKIDITAWPTISYVDYYAVPLNGYYKDLDFSSDGSILIGAKNLHDVNIFDATSWPSLTGLGSFNHPYYATALSYGVAFTGDDDIILVNFHNSNAYSGIHYFNISDPSDVIYLGSEEWGHQEIKRHMTYNRDANWYYAMDDRNVLLSKYITRNIKASKINCKVEFTK